MPSVAFLRTDNGKMRFSASVIFKHVRACCYWQHVLMLHGHL